MITWLMKFSNFVQILRLSQKLFFRVKPVHIIKQCVQITEEYTFKVFIFLLTVIQDFYKKTNKFQETDGFLLKNGVLLSYHFFPLHGKIFQLMDFSQIYFVGETLLQLRGQLSRTVCSPWHAESWKQQINAMI